MIEILDREAVIGGTMSAGEKALNNLASNQFQVAETRQAIGVEEFWHESRSIQRRTATGLEFSISPTTGLVQSTGCNVSLDLAIPCVRQILLEPLCKPT